MNPWPWPIVSAAGRSCLLLYFFLTLSHVTPACVGTVHIYILAYRSIFCNDIELLECVLMKQCICWRKCVESRGKLHEIYWGFNVVLYINPLSKLRKSLHFFPTLNPFSFQFTKYAQLFTGFCCFSITLSFIKIPTINSIHGFTCLDWF